MKIVIILAMHGMPPSDFPQKETLDYFMLHSRLENMPGPPPPAMQQQYKELDNKMRNWSRTQENDPYSYASVEIAEALSNQTGYPVSVGYNEFCAPSLDEAFATAMIMNPEKIVVITPMMTRGGEHSEKDIPEAIERAKKKKPKIEFTYVWPFDMKEIAAFLVEQLKRYF